MKRDQYIPHEVSMRNTTEVMHLIEKEGMTGYGIYWAVMEYLRTQDDYIGDFRNLKSLRRQLNIRLPKLLNIINNYGLFICDDFTFYSPKLNELMKPLEDRRARFEAYKQKKRAAKSLEISNASDTISFDKVKGKVKVKVSSSSKEEDKGDDGGDFSIPETPAWERHVNALQEEEQWKEIMAMRSGLGQAFVRRFDEVLNLFKQHVQAIGNEKDIQSPTDAKRYFCFFNTPGSATFKKLVCYLRETEVLDPYRFEFRDPETGKRSYCDVPIPDDAPPRPNDQANWNPLRKEWVF
ncbi:MAG: DUF4373 domain-containing protein [Bacteroides sp.]|nr:DUF4373 domain-containing protein [Bacteroides sp.]